MRRMAKASNSLRPLVAAAGRGLRSALLGATIAAAATTIGHAATCSPTMDKLPFQFRALQTQLMVAALTCDARSEYNAFVQKFQGVLSRNGRALDAQFRRLHGAGSERILNRFVTELANESSQDSIRNRDAFCAESLKMLRETASFHDDEIETFTRQRYATVRVEEKLCTAQRM
ncbi:MAG: hypothetical protein FJX67_16665 [Alphaproteobacteria bacterium]|nr:hypothetical protein [Alphaproteobacteria bacterium]